MKKLHAVSFLSVMIGAINWGFIGLFNFNLVNSIFGFSPAFEHIIYVIVGLSAVYLIVQHKADCKTCGSK